MEMVVTIEAEEDDYLKEELPCLTLVSRGDVMRSIVERFAHDSYSDTYGADIKTFPNEFLTLYSKNEGVLSCLGLTDASSDPLFLEQYLNQPLEKAISAVAGRSVKRFEIVETGTLAVTSTKHCRLMMSALAGLIESRGRSFIAFTAVRTLRGTLKRLAVPFTVICKADQTLLNQDTENWGRYYKADPEVVVVDLALSKSRIDEVKNNIKMETPDDMTYLMERFYNEGASLEKVYHPPR